MLRLFRARSVPDARVSAPLEWRESSGLPEPADFTVLTRCPGVSRSWAIRMKEWMGSRGRSKSCSRCRSRMKHPGSATLPGLRTFEKWRAKGHESRRLARRVRGENAAGHGSEFSLTRKRRWPV